MAARVAVAAAARAVTWVAAAAQRRSAKARVQRTAAEAADHAGRSDGAAAAAAALTSHASVSPRSSFQWMAPSAHRLRPHLPHFSRAARVKACLKRKNLYSSEAPDSPLSRNRLVLLLWWDGCCFLFCALLYLLLMHVVAYQHSVQVRHAQQHLGGYEEIASSTHLGALYSQLLQVYAGGAWSGWQAQTTNLMVKILFSVTSFPFTFFLVGPLRTLFTHTAPTGYDQGGLLADMDEVGLSATVRWLSWKIRTANLTLYGWSLPTWLSTRIDEVLLLDLRNLVREEETWLRKMREQNECACSSRPSAKQRKQMRRRLTELEERLQQLIPRTEAGSIYSDFFPNRVLQERLIDSLGERNKLYGKYKLEYFARKNNVELRKKRRAHSSSRPSLQTPASHEAEAEADPRSLPTSAPSGVLALLRRARRALVLGRGTPAEQESGAAPARGQFSWHRDTRGGHRYVALEEAPNVGEDARGAGEA